MQSGAAAATAAATGENGHTPPSAAQLPSEWGLRLGVQDTAAASGAAAAASQPRPAAAGDRHDIRKRPLRSATKTSVKAAAAGGAVAAAAVAAPQQSLLTDDIEALLQKLHVSAGGAAPVPQPAAANHDGAAQDSQTGSHSGIEQAGVSGATAPSQLPQQEAPQCSNGDWVEMVRGDVWTFARLQLRYGSGRLGNWTWSETLSPLASSGRDILSCVADRQNSRGSGSVVLCLVLGGG